jgi:hypothetical protein
MHALIRSFNDPGVVDFIRRLQATRRVEQFTVLINEREETLHTAELLSTLDSTTQINCIPLKTFGWARWLNAGLTSILSSSDKDELVLIISNHVRVRTAELDSLTAAASRESAACGYALFADRHEPSFLVPRNTCIVWRAAVFERVGLFKEVYDQDGGTGTGMEDYEMVLRAFSKEGLLPFLGPAGVKLESDPSSAKLDWENRGISLIEKEYSQDVIFQLREHLSGQSTAH